MNVLYSELLKLRRGWAGPAILAVTFLPLLAALPSLLRLRTEQGFLAWENVFGGFMEFWALGIFAILVIYTCVIFSREYQDKTLNNIFASPHPALSFLGAKLATASIVLVAALVPALLVRILAGFMLATRPAEADVLAAYAGESVLYILKNLLLVPWIALVAILMKRMFSSVLVGFAFIIMTFPFHRTESWYLFPWLAAAMHFTQAFGFPTPGNAGIAEGWISLCAFAAICSSLCALCYRRR